MRQDTERKEKVKTMVYAVIKEENGDTYGMEYRDFEVFIRETFSPLYTVLFFCDMSKKRALGKDRATKKEVARAFACIWQDVTTHYQPSYYELALVGDYFATLGRKYGLLREFRENGIC